MAVVTILLIVPAVAIIIPFYLFKNTIPPLVTMLFGCAVPSCLIGFLLFSGLIQKLVQLWNKSIRDGF